MKKIFQTIFICLVTSSFLFNISLAQTPHFIDFTKVLNESKAGKEAQDYLSIKENIYHQKMAEREAFAMIEGFKRVIDGDYALLDIDVEGADFEALRSLDFKTYNPKIICIEIKLLLFNSFKNLL